MTSIVTFYSYKGGVGRTMALVNTAHVLARDGWRVLMVDFDLEAPGMTHFFADVVRDRPQSVEGDALDLLLHAKRSLANESRIPKSLSGYVVNIRLPEEWRDKAIPYRNGRLDLLPATLEPMEADEPPESEPAHDYLARIDELDLSGIFGVGGPRHDFGDHVRKYFLNARFRATGDVLFTMRDRVQAAYDIVLIDSRTGLNEISGLCIGPVCDALVICSGLNRQNIYGTRYFMDKAGLLDRQKAKPYVVLAGPVPLWRTGESARRISLMAKELHADRVVEVPYHPTAALDETIFISQEPTEPITRAYEQLAPVIVGLVRGDEDRPGIEYVDRMIRLADQPDEGDRLRAQIHGSATQLSSTRLADRKLWRLGVLSGLPTACTIFALPNRGEFSPRWGNVEPVSLAAAISAYRLQSDRPFRRAWRLIADFVETAPGSDLAIRLLFMQLRILGTAPADELLTVAVDCARRAAGRAREEEAILKGDRGLLDLDSLITARLSESFDVSTSYFTALRKVDSFDRLLGDPELIHRFARDALLPSWEFWGGERSGPSVIGSLLSTMLISTAAEAEGEGEIHTRRKRTLREVVSQLPAAPSLGSDQGLRRRKWLRESIRFREHSDVQPAPLGLWPEPLMACALALVRGEEAMGPILTWLWWSRLSYGYAWRVLVDWRHLDSVKDHPAFVEFMRREDEQVEEVEAAITKGEYPL